MTPLERLRKHLRKNPHCGTVDDFALMMRLPQQDCMALISRLAQEHVIRVRLFSDRRFIDVTELAAKHFRNDAMLEVTWHGESKAQNGNV